MLIVLTVMMLFVGLTLIKLETVAKVDEKKAFIAELKADLYYSHMYSMSEQTAVIVNFYPADRYLIIKSGKKVLIQRQWPKHIKVLHSSMNAFIIGPNGNVSKFGTIIFLFNDNQIKLTYQIGDGRFRVEG